MYSPVWSSPSASAIIVERCWEILLAHMAPREVVACPHVALVDFQRLQVGRAGFFGAAELEQPVAERAPQLRRAGRIESERHLRHVDAGLEIAQRERQEHADFVEQHPIPRLTFQGLVVVGRRQLESADRAQARAWSIGSCKWSYAALLKRSQNFTTTSVARLGLNSRE